MKGLCCAPIVRFWCKKGLCIGDFFLSVIQKEKMGLRLSIRLGKLERETDIVGF